MESRDALAAQTRTDIGVSRSTDRLEVRETEDQVLLYTGAGTLQRSRTYARGVGALTAAAGIGLLWFSIWGLSVIALGIIMLAVVPRFIRADKLLEIDKKNAQLIVAQSTVGAGISLPLSHIHGIRGAYDTKGWDGYSVVYAVGADRSEAPILILMGTDEQFAESICRTLGALLGIPATYAGPFGNCSTCFTPEQSA